MELQGLQLASLLPYSNFAERLMPQNVAIYNLIRLSTDKIR
jgi:hypothetical protein